MSMQPAGSAHVADENELITGEAVALDVRPASMLLRAAGTLIDVLLSVLVFLGLNLLISSLLGGSGDGAIVQALSVVAIVLSVVILPMVVETASHGRSLGKLAIGARIVRDDGGGITLRHAFVRALMGVVEIYATLGGLAAIVSLLSDRSKRLGDLLAGTYSQHERVPPLLVAPAVVPPALTGWATTVDVARMPDPLSRRIAQFLAQAPELTPQTRARLAATLAADASPYVSPIPAVDAWTFLLGVAAVRREREYAALMLERTRLERLEPALRGLPHGFPER
ncbi:RDD family protein [Compostimonas suwonensis]